MSRSLLDDRLQVLVHADSVKGHYMQLLGGCLPQQEIVSDGPLYLLLSLRALSTHVNLLCLLTELPEDGIALLTILYGHFVNLALDFRKLGLRLLVEFLLVECHPRSRHGHDEVPVECSEHRGFQK